MFDSSEHTDEQAMLVAFTEKLSKQYDERYFLRTTKAQQYPQDFWNDLSQAGYLGMMVEENLGGAGLGTADLSVFVHAMANRGMASLQLVNQLVCIDLISRFASVSQKDEYLSGMISGNLWSYADMENARGNSLFDIATTAEKSGDDYILNGSKSYVIGAKDSEYLILAARTQKRDPKNPEKGICLFVVPSDASGIEYSTSHINVRLVSEREEMSATGDVFYNQQISNVKVPASACIGEMEDAGNIITWAACRKMQLVAATNLGWGDRLVDKTVDYTRQRTIFKDPIASYQAVQHPLVLAKTKIEMAKLLAERSAEVFDQEANTDVLLSYCSVSKHYAAEAAYAACDIALQAHGGAGYDRDTGVISLWPLILISRMVPLCSDTILSRFSELVLGMPNKGGDAVAIQEIHFESRSAAQEQMFADIEAVTGRGGSINMNKLLAEVQNGDLSKYKDDILSEMSGGMPLKKDIQRQLGIRINAPAVEGSGIPAYMLKVQPQKQGLSMMALSAIASGPGGKERVMKEFMPKIAEGKLFCYCITEPDAGTNTHKIRTTAQDMGDHYLLNGQKTYITAADTAYYMAVVARVERDGKSQEVGTFVFEKETAGISMTPLDIAALGDSQFAVYFENVKLPKDALVGAKQGSGSGGKGISQSVFTTLNVERIMIATSCLQAGIESLNKAIKRAKTPSDFGDVPGESESIKSRLADLRMQLEMNNLALKKATVAFDRKEDPKRIGMFVNMAKYLSSEFADEAGQLALDVYGVAGLDQDGDDIGSLCQIGRVFRTVPINNEMVLNFLAEHLLGLPKSYYV